jgi:hypothetical protein
MSATAIPGNSTVDLRTGRLLLAVRRASPKSRWANRLLRCNEIEPASLRGNRSRCRRRMNLRRSGPTPPGGTDLLRPATAGGQAGPFTCRSCEHSPRGSALADYRAKIGKSRSVLQSGEPVLATVRAAVEGSPLGVLGGIPALLAVSSVERSHAVAQGFPASRQMVLAVTDRRLLVFRTRSLRRRLEFRGEVPFEALHAVSLHPGLSPRLRFVLSSGAELTFTTYRLDHPNEFIRVLNRARQDRTPAAPGIPKPAPIPVIPPPPPL